MLFGCISFTINVLLISPARANISPMPPGLFNRLNEQELTDLLAFLVSGGNKNNKVYKN
jgi:hypothetical protein